MIFKMKKVATEDATDDQIKSWVQSLDVDTSEVSSRAGLLALLSSVGDDSFVMVPDLPKSVEDAMQQQMEAITSDPQQRLAGGLGDGDPLFRIKLGTTEMPGGKDPVPVAVNGRAVVIQRGMTVDLPARFFFALENAKRAQVSQNTTTGEITETEINNYPMEIVSRPDTAALIAWHMSMDEQSNPL